MGEKVVKRDLVITSRQNPKIKAVCALSEKKEREARGLFRFDGIKLFLEAYENGVEIESVFIRESSAEALEVRVGDKLSTIEERVVPVTDLVFDKLSDEKAPEGIITVAKTIDKIRKIVKIEEGTKTDGESMIILESLRDPGNVGTIIRCAAALGIDRVVMSSDCADIYNPKTIRAAMGGLFRIKIDTVSISLLPDYVRTLRREGRRVFAAALDEKSMPLGSFPCKEGDCFIIGNEGHGLSAELIEAADHSVIIPMREGCESLNAAMAAVILMWETGKKDF